MSKEETKPDDDGQETETTYYSYDHENRLTNLEYVGDSEGDILNASFEYDGNGLRTKATEGSMITKYYYDGLNVLFEKDAAGLTQKSYTRGLGFPGGIGGLISLKRFEQDDDGLEEKTSYYHYDALGSVRGLSNEQGKLNAEFDYDAFGNGKNNKKWNTYRFSSKEFEDHAGLYFFGARYYDPEIGRWLTPDPLGSVDGPDVFLYVKNNPLNLIDPYGLLGEKNNLLNALQWGFDVAGLMPVYGEIFDLTNAGIYYLEGDNINAGLSAAAAVPFIGLSATIPKIGIKGSKAVADKITGYTRHGLEQAIGREGRGVAIKEMLDAVRNPVEVIKQSNGTTKYIGQNATVVLNDLGEIVTTWGKPR